MVYAVSASSTGHTLLARVVLGLARRWIANCGTHGNPPGVHRVDQNRALFLRRGRRKGFHEFLHRLCAVTYHPLNRTMGHSQIEVLLHSSRGGFKARLNRLRAHPVLKSIRILTLRKVQSSIQRKQSGSSLPDIACPKDRDLPKNRKICPRRRARIPVCAPVRRTSSIFSCIRDLLARLCSAHKVQAHKVSENKQYLHTPIQNQKTRHHLWVWVSNDFG